MIPARTRRSAVSLLATLGLLIGSVALPAATLAKVPNWDNAGSYVTALPPVVSTGTVAGYEVAIRNGGPSNIPSLYLFNSDPALVTAYVSDNTHCSTAGTPLNCSFGALRKNETLTLTVAYQVPSVAGSFGVDFVWNTTGLGSGASDNSHGDALTKHGATVVSNDANYAGRFLVPGDPGFAQTDPNISVSNPQASYLSVNARGIGIGVGENNEDACPNAPGLSCFGQATRLTVGDGSAKYGVITLLVKLHRSEIPSQINAGNLGVVHVKDNGALEELPTCNGPATNVPCKIVQVLGPTGMMTLAHAGGGHDTCGDHHAWSRKSHGARSCPSSAKDLIVTIYLNENGYVKFH